MEKPIKRPLWPTLLLAVVVGTVAFGITFGFTVLDPTRDNWLLYLYNDDLVQHYAGWCAFQKSPWHFPLGLADKMAYGTYITYTDSIPLVAIVVKFLLELVGYTGTFQYFGLYALLCYILQAFVTGLLVRRKTHALPLQGLAMVLFCFTPVLMDRTLRHTALGSHWMILLAIYAFLRCRDNGFRRYPWLFYLLGFLAITIHPYFIPMTMIFALITVVHAIVYRKRWLPALAYVALFAGNLVTCYYVGRGIGALNDSFKIARLGYGRFSMNLNSPINPTSAAGYDWSAFLPQMPILINNTDGFTYLGLGVMLLVLGCVVALVVRRQLVPFLKANWFYLLAMVGMTLFALSNVLTLNDRILFTIPLPESIVYLCGIFRASSRMFYTVIYSLMVWSVSYLCGALEGYRRQSGWRSRPVIALTAVFAAVVVLQLFDIHGGITGLHRHMDEQLNSTSLADNAELQQKLSEYDILAWDPNHEVGELRAMVLCAIKNDMVSLYSVANTGIYPYEQANAENTRKWEALEQGQTSPDTAYVTTDAETAQRLAGLNPTAELMQVENFYLLFPQKS